MKNWVSVAAATAVLVMVLTGCGPQSEAHDLTREDIVGVWSLQVDRSDATISMNGDGTFVARSWPENLLCREAGALKLDDLEWENPSTIHGTWQSGRDFPYLLFLTSDEESCGNASWIFKVWEFGEKDYRFQVFLDGVRDPESASEDQSVWISKIPTD